ncbi:hypothetical protein PUN28_009339 [Cardiocondyla obscurior]|uniref:Secreted protein n=1 Tax=Cardiocondyla obscurior TaxID=286306 RepID=A0AAW2FTX2_9HYME
MNTCVSFIRRMPRLFSRYRVHRIEKRIDITLSFLFSSVTIVPSCVGERTRAYVSRASISPTTPTLTLSFSSGRATRTYVRVRQTACSCRN